jgi:threonine synthase
VFYKEKFMLRYVSTRDPEKSFLESHQTIVSGLAPDGGLYTPYPIGIFLDPRNLLGKSYRETAFEVMSKFLDDFDRDVLCRIIERAYGGKFDTPAVAPLRKAGDIYLLELWHGPTSAFKDIALTVLPMLMTESFRMEGIRDTAFVLTATSGDTGKAALSGFADVPGTAVTVFYPEYGVSDIQKRQMQTSRGSNVNVIAVKGNFDDCQRMVKEASSDPRMRMEAARRHVRISSANSINVGRLVPQIVYYYKSYCDLVSDGVISCGDPVDYAVPTGNFGDILAGFLAKYIGLPVRRLICASNINNVLTDFLTTGVYTAKRPFHTTMSPSMDILVSSNLERLLFIESGGDSDMVTRCMNSLSETGRFSISPSLLSRIQDSFSGYYATEEQCSEEMRLMMSRNGVLIDPHTAVAVHAARESMRSSGEKVPCVVLSTASPFKFPVDVLRSVAGIEENDAFKAMDVLSEMTGERIPAGIDELRKLDTRFSGSVEPLMVKDAVIRSIEEIGHD